MFTLHASAQTSCLQYKSLTRYMAQSQALTNPALGGCANLSEALKNTKAKLIDAWVTAIETGVN